MIFHIVPAVCAWNGCQPRHAIPSEDKYQATRYSMISDIGCDMTVGEGILLILLLQYGQHYTPFTSSHDRFTICVNKMSN